MTCELFRVDFRRKVLKERTTLGKDAQPYDPRKCPVVSNIVDHAMVMLAEAHEQYADPRRAVFLLADPSRNFSAAMFDTEFLSTDDAIESLEAILNKLYALRQQEEQGDPA